jgi:hypothetical protein
LQVVTYDTRSSCHTVKYQDNGAEATVDLKDVSWNIHNERGAPGANPERQGGRRALESSDDEDLLEVRRFPTITWNTFACPRSRFLHLASINSSTIHQSRL